MSWFVVDVEADGPIPGKYSMVCFGAVKVTPSLDETFYGRTKPVTSEYVERALSVSGFTRAQHEAFPDPKGVMEEFVAWVKASSVGHPIFVSDNIAFDWQWINWYLHTFIGKNIFGYSGRRIGDIYAGLQHNIYASWKHLRKTKHTHHPVDDAKGNAEAILEFVKLGLRGLR